jgi:hypothetical protein
VSNLEDKFEKLLGNELTDPQRQELLKMSKTLEIADNDALWSVVALLYSFDARYAKIPQRIEGAANAAAESAAKQAEAQINQAVASLAPAMQKTVEKAANRAVGRLQLAESAGMIYATIVIVGLFGGVCFALGNRSYGMFQEHKISAPVYWEQMKWAISAGFFVPGFLMVGYLVLKDGDYEWQKLGYFLILVGVGVTAVLPLKLLGVIH